MFLAHKDLQGKTQIHDSKCIHRGTRGTFQCGCPLRRSAASMDSLIGQIRAIFRDEASRGKNWDDLLGIGNPAAAPIIKRYLSAMKLEQSASVVIPKKAAPLFVDKLTIISRHISSEPFFAAKVCLP